MEQSMHLNNAGVFLLSNGQYEAAKEVFQDALSAKLIQDAFQNYGGSTEHRSPSSIPSPSSMTAQLDAQLKKGLITSESKSLKATEPECVLRLYDRGFEVSPDDTISGVNAAIVFNLGLVYQMENRFSPQAPLYYKIAMALLVGSPPQGTVSISAALLNNLAAWHQDNNDHVTSSFCSEMLSNLLGNVGEAGLDPFFRFSLKAREISTPFESSAAFVVFE